MEAIAVAGRPGARLCLAVADTQGHGSHKGTVFFGNFSWVCPVQRGFAHLVFSLGLHG